MTYVLDSSQAKFAGAQAGLKRHIGLRQRLRVKHAVNSLRQPRRWAERTAAYRSNRAAIAEYASREFEVDGCVNVTRQLEAECSAAVARWKPRCDSVLAEKGDSC